MKLKLSVVLVAVALCMALVALGFGFWTLYRFATCPAGTGLTGCLQYMKLPS